MARHASYAVALVSILIALLPGSAGAEEDGAAEPALPTWVLAPPPRDEWIRFVDCGQSNLLDLAYAKDDRAASEALVWHAVLDRLQPLLGEDAVAAAEAAARHARLVQRAHYHQAASPARRSVPGGQVYTVWVLGEVPLQPVISAVPEAKRSEARDLLLASPPGAGRPWIDVAAEPAWALEVPKQDSVFTGVTSESSDRQDVAEGLSALRAASHLRWRIQARLVPLVGSEHAHDVGMRAAAHRRLVRRARHVGDAVTRTWQLWAVPEHEVLALLPTEIHPAAREALAGPVPARPWVAVEVSEEPAWVTAPTAWPGYVPVVQTQRSERVEQAEKRSAKQGEKVVAQALERRLRPVLDEDTARRAAAAGARRRKVARKAKRESPATVWTLWQVPLERVLGSVPPEHADAARRALLPAAPTPPR